MNVRVRLAPSPTGNLHIGTARTAVFNWLFARNQGGTFILRVEDTDVERSKSEYTDNILEGLTWLGMNWDEGPSFQSQRLEIYRQTVQTLLDKGLAYRCYTTSAELDEMREAQKANKQAPRYDNRHRHLTEEQRAAFEAEGRQAVIRFIIEDDRTIAWNDMVRDTVTWKGSDLGGDMVIARASSGGLIGQPLYNLAVVADDIDMAITHVIRGEDHIGNTPKQILLYEALGATIPEFAHTPLILNAQGQKLSKRDGVTSISDFKDMGYIPEALVNYMTLLGWTAPDSTQEIFTLSEAAAVFTFDRVNKAGAKFDWDKLNWLNGQYLHKMPVPQLTDLLIPYWQKAGYEFDSKADRPWLEQIAALIGPSLVRLTDAVGMCKLFFLPTLEYEEEALAQLQQSGAAQALQAVQEALESHPTLIAAEAQKITKKLSKEKNLNKGLIMRSLRAALTGAMHGPDLIESWVILHQRGTAKTRLLDAISNLNLPAVGVAAETPSLEQPKAETPAEISEREQPAVEVSTVETQAVELSAAEVTAVETPTLETVETPLVEPAAEVTAVETPTLEPAAEVTAVETPTLEPAAEVTAVETPTLEPAAEVTAVETPAVSTVGTEVSAVDISAVETAAAAVEIPAANQQKTIASGEMTSSNEPETTVIITEIPAENEADSSSGSTKVIITEEPNQTQQIKEQIISILSEFPAYIGSFYEQYKSPLTVVGVILASIVSLKVLLGIVDELNDIPLLAPTFELIGIGYSAWFIYRYLLRSSNRQQLGQEIQALKEQVFGKKS
ncbi:MAG: glutamate--tRNA ligase [Microcoleus sp. PH2017_25_DOB_D_A]|jgi:glutamyl-tRNA synthetase|nr:glutamate--tRNA ligase [Microcoleus sp. PH2017_07_MST_O_A]MCC3510099.1 glutamate--tRNA ligase [Microcoleus sp. PH2017_17_BER_D_A]MCC3533950.1 glutamate--tRNA ligase [Microcoleus sp. PH2017_25_DOB_D_A]MCC3546107.1 glutamate--tRNA ligase [Microcoleus sp. PH2017_24_DOB_U_A]MCC3574956.1 glutamate--tRNA ligase [Microcoleus sp. PH2017_34_RAT_O_A]MCC3584312.1 glutamate--tRNA ligase [Microcoleus sp. PH2017_30_WIL_O_A]MCC3612564.1 glutamate--tRNA ligase [Microcoleus sp. PH2017_40_RAT_O_B]TAE15506.